MGELKNWLLLLPGVRSALSSLMYISGKALLLFASGQLQPAGSC